MINADDMQSWAYLLAPTFQFVNTAGKPLTEGWIEVYIAGTRDKYYCASDFNGTLHPFQIPLDSLGANIVLADPSQAYDVYVYNKYGSLIMSRYHVSPGMAGGSGVLNITITSEDGTVSVNNDGNGNFDLSIQDTIDRIDVLEQTVSGLSSNSSVGYAIAHAYTVELDGSFDLINDAVTGIGYTPNMDGFRLKSGHVYQFNFNALFENGAFDRNCSGKLYLEGPNTIAQEWKFDLDDSYYHSQSINGSTVLVTPNDLNYYDVKLKLAWDVDYPNKPNVDLNKISIVDITTILSTTVSGVGGDYIAGDGIFINDETNVISVDMDYINSHLNINASEIIASAVNIATAYTDARVTSVSGDLVNLIAEVSASIPTGTVTQVQSDWNEQDSSSPAYINNKPDLTVYATNASLTAVSSVLQSEIDAISGAIPTDYVTHNEVSAVSANLVNYINSVSGDITNYVDESIVSAINVATGSFEQVQSDWTEDDTNDPAYIKNKPNEIELIAGQNIGIFSDATTITIAASATDLSGYATNSEVSAVSAAIVNQIPDISAYATHTEVNNVSAAIIAQIPEQQVNSDWTATSGVAEILNKPNESELIAGAGVSITASGSNYIISAVVTGTPVLSGYVTEAELETVSGNIVNQIPDVSNLATKQEVATVSGMIPDISGLATNADLQIVSAAIPDVSNYATRTEVNTVSGVLEGQIQTVSAAIPDVSNFATETQVIAVSGTLQTEVMAISGIVSTLPTAVPGIVAGSGIDVTASGNDYIISCTVTGGGESYNAGDYIGITDNTISVTGITDLVAGNAITITASGNSAIISSTGEAQVQSDWNVTDSSSKAYIKNKPTIPAAQVQSNWNETNTSSKAYIQNKPTIHTYTGASGISISSDVVTLDNPIGLVAGTNVSIEVTGSSAIISAVGGSGTSDVTMADLVSVSGTLQAEIQTVSAAIPDVSNFVTGPTVSAIVDTALIDVPTGVSGLVGGTNVSITASGSNYVIDATVPDVSNLATKTEVTTGLGTKQNTLTGITDVQVVQSLPVSPVSTVLYLIPEV